MPPAEVISFLGSWLGRSGLMREEVGVWTVSTRLGFGSGRIGVESVRIPHVSRESSVGTAPGFVDSLT